MGSCSAPTDRVSTAKVGASFKDYFSSVIGGALLVAWVLVPRPSTAEVKFSTPHIEAGYFASGEVLNATKFSRCYYAIGDRLSVSYEAKDPLQAFSTTKFTSVGEPQQTTIRTSFSNADGRTSYFCLTGLSSIGLEIVAGHASHNTNIGKNMQCILSLSSFKVEPAPSGSIANFQCSYDAATGTVSALASGPGTLSGCSYICGKQTFTSAVTTISAASSYSPWDLGGIQTFPKNLQCAVGTNSFSTKCSSLGKIPEPNYDSSSGAAKRSDAFSCPDGQPSPVNAASMAAFYSYLCVQRHTVYECDNGIDDDQDGLPDKSDPGCWSNATDPSTYEPLRGRESRATTQCQDGIDNDADGKIDMNDPGCEAPTDPSESPDPAPTPTPTPTPQNTPTYTPIPPEPTNTPSPTAEPSRTHTPTSSPIGTNTPAISPSPTHTSEGGSNSATPTATPITTKPMPNETIGGDVIVSGRALEGALVYLPEFVDVAVTDKSGSFKFMGVNPANTNAVLKVRSTQMENSGMDIPARAGVALEVRPQSLRNYNPNRCPESDKLLALYRAARKIRRIYLIAVEDQKQLKTGFSEKTDRYTSGRALRRLTYHAQLYFDLSATLPDRQLLCQKPPTSCSKVDLRKNVRRMKSAALQVRMEGLLINRQLRLKTLRTVAQSEKRIKQIRSSDQRARAHIAKLARSTFECSSAGQAKNAQHSKDLTTFQSR